MVLTIDVFLVFDAVQPILTFVQIFNKSIKFGQPPPELAALDIDAHECHHHHDKHNIRPQFTGASVPIQQLQHRAVFLLEASTRPLCLVSDFVNQALLMVQLCVDVLSLKFDAVQLFDHYVEHLVDFFVVSLESVQTLLLILSQLPLLLSASKTIESCVLRLHQHLTL